MAGNYDIPAGTVIADDPDQAQAESEALTQWGTDTMAIRGAWAARVTQTTAWLQKAFQLAEQMK